MEIAALKFRLLALAAWVLVSVQIALAWVLAQKPWIVPIPGTTKVDRLEENLKAEAITLTEADLREIENTFSGIQIQGARYPASLQNRVGK